MANVFQDVTELYNELTLIPSFHTGDAALLEYSGFVTRFKESSLAPCEVNQNIQNTFIDAGAYKIRELTHIAYSRGNIRLTLYQC